VLWGEEELRVMLDIVIFTNLRKMLNITLKYLNFSSEGTPLRIKKIEKIEKESGENIGKSYRVCLF